VALNREVDDATASLLVETFLECIVAPSFAPSALERLRGKKALRLLATGAFLPADQRTVQLRRVGGGFVAQERDATGPREVTNGNVVTGKAPSSADLAALEFAWLVCKHVKSNAIVLARPAETAGSFVTTGIGGGQTARVTSVNIACEKAGELAKGSVLASDAFFPFADGVEAAAKHGIVAVAQPGGSKNDESVISTANQLGMTMVFTGNRHFRH
jgi:phosphoribosylaminoimidazolecarboxamide formyltransferase/IMP cyclohydrolase